MTIDFVTATRLVGPGVLRTTLAQIRKKPTREAVNGDDKSRAGDNDQRPSDETVYAESVRLMRQMMKLVCLSTVEDMHAATERRSPAPPSVRVVNIDVPALYYDKAAELVQKQLGPNLDRVGRTWWQWREPRSEIVKAQWVEMKVDYAERVRKGDEGKKVMFYVHGGAYYLGGIGHDMQVQRHARKLKGRCFAPRYRLAPEFPFPCAIQDILSAYLYLLDIVKPEHVVLAGDSAGAGLCLAMLLIIRDQGLPMPAGASLISPWVDLTHSFPSITEPTDFDYVPSTGFQAKPSMAWPPPSPDERRALGMKENLLMPPDYVIDLDGKSFTIADQVNMYAPNLQLVYPLVSPIHAATLGGLCPCQVIIGGAELLRDEQLYLAHKMADPKNFPLSDKIVSLNGENPKDMHKFAPTDVELLVFDDGPHAAPTLGHIDIAKHQYRAVAQFAAWALAKAQNAEIEVEAYGTPSQVSLPRPCLALRRPTSPTLSRCEGQAAESGQQKCQLSVDGCRNLVERDAAVTLPPSEWSGTGSSTEHGDMVRIPEKLYVDIQAGGTLPHFERHMRRYRVDRIGRLYVLEAPHLLRALSMPLDRVGEVSGEAIKGWIQFKSELDVRFASERKKVFQKRLSNAQKGYLPVANGETPPHSALVGRRVVGKSEADTGSTGAGNTILGKLFWRIEKGGPGAAGRTDTMQNVELSTSQGKRSSRTVRPDGMMSVENSARP